MSNRNAISLTAAAFLTCVSGMAARATTVSQTQTSGPTQKSFAATQIFTSFVAGNVIGGVTIPVGAVLTSVTDTISDSENFTFAASNPNTGVASFTAAGIDTATKTIVTGFTLTGMTTASATGTLGATASATGSASASGSASAAAAAGIFSEFEGANITASVTDVLSATSTGSPNGINVNGTGTGTVTDVLVYGFSTPTPTPTPAPEPATLSLLGSGLVGLGLARLARRRRKH